jgi:hypothetical protein
MDTERLDRLDIMIRENRVIRRAWTEGHERACLLAALSPEAGKAQSASECPAEVMPRWLAHLTPWLDDAPSEQAWPALVRRYAGLARRWHALDAAAWERARIGVLIVIVTEARRSCPQHEAQALAAIDEVLAWLRQGAPDSGRLAAEWAAEAAAGASAKAAWASAEAAAEAAQWASASACSATAARAEASDRIAIGVLDAIEREIVAAEGTP